LSPAIAKVKPEQIRRKLYWDVSDDIPDDKWPTLTRLDLATVDKHVSIALRYRDGMRWEETPLFRKTYAERFAKGQSIRGRRTEAELLAQYYGRVDAMYADMRANGFRLNSAPIPVYIAADGEILLGNQGNHRLAMAQVLGLPFVVVDVLGSQPGRLANIELLPEPDLPDSVNQIPAMTTVEERRCYYRLTREAASTGAVVELGAWLGAATAYIAAGMRDSGVKTKAHTFDRFVWKPSSHDKKAGGPLGLPPIKAFRRHLGPLMEHVDVHAGELRDLAWTSGPVSLLICDAPKRIREISLVLRAFADSIRIGTVLAWQDFAYFPSYDIPAAMMRLSDHVELVDAVHPGTTAVFRVVRPWSADQVSDAALSIRRWTPDEVESAWDAWGDLLPVAMRPRFACGAAMFLCDLGATGRAQKRLKAIIADYGDDVVPKWRYLIEERSGLMQRYAPLAQVVQQCA